nr:MULTISPECIES: fimbrial protein [Proteus]
MRHEGVTQLVGSVISTPCSIVMSNRYQTVDFSSLTMTKLSTAVEREQQTRPFDIELRDCGSVYSTIDSKTWTIRFDGQGADNIHAFVLQGPSQGLGVSVLDNTKNILIPGESYPLFKSVLRQGKSGQTLFLRYFLRLELTGKPLQAGSYQGLVRFFIDYQ